MSDDDSPSLWNIQRLIERNYADSKEDILDLKSQISRQQEVTDMRFNQYLLKAVYEAEKKAYETEKKAHDERIARLEQEVAAARARAITAIYTAMASATAAILAGIVLAVFLGGV